MNKKVLVIVSLALALLLALGGFAFLRFSPYGIWNSGSAKNVLNDYILAHDDSFWREQFVSLSTPEVTEFESASDVALAMYDACSGDWSFREWREQTSICRPVYILSKGGRDLFAAALSVGGTGWEVTELRCPGFLSGETRTLTITVPAEATVTCNGIPVDPSYITDSAVAYDDMSALESSILNHPCRVTYELPGICLACEIDVQSEEGVFLLHADGTRWEYTRANPGAHTLRISAPENATVNVGGTALDPSSATERSVYVTRMDVPEEYQSTMPAYLVYSIGGLYGEYDVTATLNGEPLDSTVLDGTMAFALPGDETLRESNHEQVEDFLRRLCQYGAGGFNPYEYCVSGSQVSEFLSLAINSVYWVSNTQVSFDAVDAYDFVSLGENAFICRGRVLCTTKTAYGAWDQDFRYEMLWLRNGDLWYISDLAYL